jgi:hypothetical protein
MTAQQEELRQITSAKVVRQATTNILTYHRQNCRIARRR